MKTTTTDLHPRTLAFLRRHPWAIAEAALDELVGIELGPELQAKLEAAIARSQAAPRPNAGAVAVLPIHGPITKRTSLFSFFFGGTSIEGIREMLRTAMADPAISGIVLDIDSPGGTVYGTDTLAAEIAEAQKRKPIVAFTSGMMCSAAYWLGCAATQVVADPGSEIGSIGIVMVHQEESKLEAEIGITTTIIRTPAAKSDANPHEPLSSDAQAALEARCADYYAQFTARVAKSRKVPIADVRAGFGKGREIGASAAVAEGMADRLGTLDEVIADLARGKIAASGAAAVAADADFRFRARTELALLEV